MTWETDGQGQQQYTDQHSKWHTQHLSTGGDKKYDKYQSAASFLLQTSIVILSLFHCILAANWKTWLYLLFCDKHLDQKDAEEDESGTANIVFEHWQVQGSVLEREEHKHMKLMLWYSKSIGIWDQLSLLSYWYACVYLTCFSKSFFGNHRANLTLSSDLDHCLRVGGEQRQNKGRMGKSSIEEGKLGNQREKTKIAD